jgi:hypothetical protein
MQRFMIGALVVAVLALVAGGCGGGSKPLSAAQLRTQASAVCRDVARRVHALEGQATQATLHASLARAATVFSDGLDRLEALEPPSQLADRYDSFLAWKGAQRDAARELSKPGGRLDARSRAAVRAHESPVRVLAQQLDMPACA